MIYDIDKDYDDRLLNNLTKRLNRAPLAHEIINGDNDSDLVNQTLWELILSLHARVLALESKQGLQAADSLAAANIATDS